MNVTADALPVAGTLPVPVQPVQAYWVPVPGPAETGDATDSVMLDPLKNQPLEGDGEP